MRACECVCVCTHVGTHTCLAQTCSLKPSSRGGDSRTSGNWGRGPWPCPGCAGQERVAQCLPRPSASGFIPGLRDLMTLLEQAGPGAPLLTSLTGPESAVAWDALLPGPVWWLADRGVLSASHRGAGLQTGRHGPLCALPWPPGLQLPMSLPALSGQELSCSPCTAGRCWLFSV